jgi:hypothetical protein
MRSRHSCGLQTRSPSTQDPCFFVYVHIAVFALWMLVLERSPWPTLTLAVSLEAIFLSTFVMIGQNRQATFQQQKADHDFLVEEHELDTNTDLTQTIARPARSTEPWSSPARKPQASKPASAVGWESRRGTPDG